MLETLFNIIFILLLLRFYGDRIRDFYFNPTYRRLSDLTDPAYRFASRLLPAPQNTGAHLLFFVLFILIRSFHYYSYRTQFLGLGWGPAALVWQSPSFLSTTFKALMATGLFYFHLLIILLLFDWLTQGRIMGDPLWRMAQTLIHWPKSLFKKFKLFWVWVATLLMFSLFFYLLLLPFQTHVVLIPGGLNGLTLFPKILILNLFLAEKIFSILFVLLLIRVFLSWFFPYGIAGIGDLVSRLTEPLVQWFSRWNLRMGPIDFSVLVASLLCLFLDQFCRTLLIRAYLLF